MRVYTSFWPHVITCFLLCFVYHQSHIPRVNIYCYRIKLFNWISKTSKSCFAFTLSHLKTARCSYFPTLPQKQQESSLRRKINEKDVQQCRVNWKIRKEIFASVAFDLTFFRSKLKVFQRSGAWCAFDVIQRKKKRQSTKI